LLIAVGDGRLKILSRRRQHLIFEALSATKFNFFSDVGDSAKKYKMAIFKPKASKLETLHFLAQFLYHLPIEA
jgi:hypothetical protein